MDDRSFVAAAINSHSGSSDQENPGTSGRSRAECVTRRYYITFSVIMFVVALVVVLICEDRTREKQNQKPTNYGRAICATRGGESLVSVTLEKQEEWPILFA
ncbi:hypothetical protein RRG08_023242 [Elysia crispata]|uniref:Transmembrane protein n=1 Tax=Elysia crispata TaxID=231223 RepID=A0AAE0ZQ70_9GAST|nr:hypothetical protein RRG08_023242 [Elysia crispata]